jgi:hypothetical protein
MIGTNETINPFVADHQHFYKAKEWTKDRLGRQQSRQGEETATILGS